MSNPAHPSAGPSSHASGEARILLISNMWPSKSDPVFGVFVRRHVEALRARGASVRVVSNRDTRGGLWAILKYASLLSRSIAVTTSGPYDVVVGHYLYPTAAVASVVSRILNVPCVLVAHGTDVRSIQHDSLIARACRRAITRAGLLVTVSHALATRLQDAVSLGASSRVTVIDMGVDTGVFRPDPASRTSLDLSPEERIILFAGKLVEVKGVDVLLDAFALLRAAGAADQLVLVGDGPLRSALRDRAHAQGIADHVTFLGQLPQAEVARWMSAADVFVLPSRDEGLGLVLLEAMACGTPCVGTSVGGIPEALPEACGRLVEPERSEELARAIAELMGADKAVLSVECVRQASAHSVDGQAALFLQEIEGLMSK
jgi:glycosyltransferase involved in cell wall biosynthesis